jgi:hypothetical protein
MALFFQMSGAIFVVSSDVFMVSGAVFAVSGALFYNQLLKHFFRAFWTSESESADFSEFRVRNFRTLKTLWTRSQRVC